MQFHMTKRNLYLVFGILALLVIVLGAGWFMLREKDSNLADPATQDSPAAEEEDSRTKAAVPQGTSVPEVGSSVPDNVAAPQIVKPSAPGAESQLREYETIEVRGDVFTPDTVIVSQGDFAHFNIVAVDKNYDFYQPDYGLRTALSRGETKLIEFKARSSGKFMFYCSSCGGPDRGPVGYIVVVPK